jgi:hypothetical protein
MADALHAWLYAPRCLHDSFFLFALGRGFGLATLAAAAYCVKEALSPEGLQLESALERVGQWWSSREDGPLVAAWAVAAVFAVSLVDYIISLPVLNLLLPGAFQALGIACGAVLALRYGKEGKPPQADVDAAGAVLQDLLPGLKK